MGLPPRCSVVLVGLGHHARRVYFPALAERCHGTGLRLRAVVDIDSRIPDLRAFFAQQNFEPEELLAGADEFALDPKVAAQLETLLAAGELDAMIVSTPPEAHKPYALWALEHDVDVLIDKPITAPSGRPDEIARRLLEDFEELEMARSKSRSRCLIMAQRRCHPGYEFVRSILREIAQVHGLSPSFLDVYHADGMWVLPNEWDRNYHPYKYGSGKLLHSGYHFVDLAAWLLGPEKLGSLDFSLRRTKPSDVNSQLEGRYEALFKKPGFKPRSPANIKGHGEVDLFLLGQLQRPDTSMTTLSLQLLQNSFSRRHFIGPATDPYKGAGRVRHERVNLQLGPLCNIQVHSYQAHELNDSRSIRDYGPGHIDHFDVQVYRNPELIGGPPYALHSFGSSAQGLGHNEAARRSLLARFLSGHPSGSSLEQHWPTIALLAAIFRGLQDLDDGFDRSQHLLWPHSPKT